MRRFNSETNTECRFGHVHSENCLELPDEHFFWNVNIPEGKDIQFNGLGEEPTLVDKPIGSPIEE